LRLNHKDQLLEDQMALVVRDLINLLTWKINSINFKTLNNNEEGKIIINSQADDLCIKFIVKEKMMN